MSCQGMTQRCQEFRSSLKTKKKKEKVYLPAKDDSLNLQNYVVAIKVNGLTVFEAILFPRTGDPETFYKQAAG